MEFRQLFRFVRMVLRIATSFSVTLFAGFTGSLPMIGSAASTGSHDAVSGSGMARTTFQDPFEQAFSVEVPQGWKVRGDSTATWQCRQWNPFRRRAFFRFFGSHA